MASYPKNIKRNKSRPSLKKKGYYSGMQRSYYKPVEKPQEKTLSLFK